MGLLVAALFSGCNTMYGQEEIAEESQWLWESVSPESQGIQSEDMERLVDHVESNDIAIDSVIIYRNGTIPFEVYFDPYDKNISHNMKSTSKGVISMLVGIAIEEGFIESVDESVYAYFPEHEVDDRRKLDITTRDLLTMSAGLRWEENGINSMYTFFVSRRITERVLSLPVVEEPGETFTYNTGLTHLLSAIISKATGMSTLEFAQDYLFGPLDIQNVQWDRDRDGYYIGGAELFLTPRAMTKLGVMYLQNGMYSGVQVVPAEWVRESTRTQIEGSFHGAAVEYGYLWWLNVGNPLFTYLNDEAAFLAMGVHGQRILVLPDQETVVVITADQGDESQCDLLIRDYILPALQG
jgi:CubicO group peptidase (beta-lactamase class C family)